MRPPGHRDLVQLEVHSTTCLLCLEAPCVPALNAHVGIELHSQFSRVVRVEKPSLDLNDLPSMGDPPLLSPDKVTGT